MHMKSGGFGIFSAIVDPMDERAKDDKEVDRGPLTINEDDAAVVRRIFRDFAGGNSQKR
ncbi:hypothetical protein RHIZ404_170015 [Rhizobium sp. EC-SD404]|nr:hypothetical protein RHIZ404_170015 [Rhizobium sp. EC-SD404]